jgi:hypothetical protein
VATWIVREEIEHLDLGAYRSTADTLLATLTDDIGKLYRTACPHYGDAEVPVKYAPCVAARNEIACYIYFFLFYACDGHINTALHKAASDIVFTCPSLLGRGRGAKRLDATPVSAASGNYKCGITRRTRSFP